MIYFEDVDVDQCKESRAVLMTAEAMMDFASEWDPQPFHTSEEAAADTPLGLIASSTHTYALSMKLCVELITEPSATVAGLGVDEMRMSQPVRPGDSLRLRMKIENKRESKSNPKVGIVVSRLELLNQHDEVVLSYLNSGMVLRRPVD